MKMINITSAAIMALLASTAASADPPAQPPATQLPKMTVSDTVDSEYVAPDATSATKTDTPIMETPRSVYVVPQEVLQDQQALTLDRILSNVPGVNAGGGAGIQESITLRGFFTSTTFVNGFRLEEYSTTGGGTLGATTITNVDRVEVLLGPAAILYGRVEPGGMVNILTKQPEDQFSVSAQQLVGSWSHYVTSADLNAPLNAEQTLLFRVNASYDTADSWRDTIYDRVSFLAPALKWKIDPTTTLTLEGELRRSVANLDVQAVPVDPNTNSLVWIPRSPTFLQDPITFDTTRYFETLSHEFDSNWSITQKYMHALSIVPTASDYYANDMYQQNGAWIVDRTLNVNSSLNKTDAAIVDLVGHFHTGAVRHTLLVGADFYRTEVNFTGASTASLSTTPVINPTPPSLTPDPAFSYYVPQVSNDYGIYVQDQIKLTRSLQLALGERFQHFDTSSGFEAPVGTPLTASPSTRDKAFTPQVGVLWQSRDWLRLYASYATNFGKNNGFDYQFKPLDPESGKQFEVGAKTELLGGRVMMSAAWFDLTKTNLAIGDPLHPNFQVTIGQVRSRGAEWAIQGEVAPGWNVIANVSYDPTLITIGGPPGSGYVQGDPLAGDPNWMANFWTTYKLPQSHLAGWKVGVGANWRDASGWPGATNVGTALTTPAYWVCSAMASYERPVRSAKVSFQLNIENLFNHFYYYDLYPVAASNYTDLNYSTPRSVTVALKVAF